MNQQKWFDSNNEPIAIGDTVTTKDNLSGRVLQFGTIAIQLQCGMKKLWYYPQDITKEKK
jgi:hypothetical protein